MTKRFLVKFFLAKIFWTKYLVKTFLAKIFSSKIFSAKIFFSDPSPHLTALYNTLPLLSSLSVIFEVECDTTNETNEGLTDWTDAMIVPFIVLD